MTGGMKGNGLQDRLLDAHRRNDKQALVALYAEAADQAQDDSAAGFFLTHAYVFALETGAPVAPTLRGRLKAMGREA